MSRQSPKAKAKMEKDKELADEWNKKSFGKKPSLIKRIKNFFANLGKNKKPRNGVYTRKDKKRSKRKAKVKNRNREKTKKKVAKKRISKAKNRSKTKNNKKKKK